MNTRSRTPRAYLEKRMHLETELTVRRAVAALQNLDACGEALRWLDGLPGHGTAAAAWRLCPRADWLAWLPVKVGVDRQRVTAAICDCLPLPAEERLRYLKIFGSASTSRESSPTLAAAATDQRLTWDTVASPGAAGVEARRIVYAGIDHSGAQPMLLSTALTSLALAALAVDLERAANLMGRAAAAASSLLAQDLTAVADAVRLAVPLDEILKAKSNVIALARAAP